MGRKLREENGIKLPKRVWKVIDRVRDGGKLCKFLRPIDGLEGDTQFFIEPKGSRIAAKSAQEAIKSGLLKPVGDGLFGEETSQTWVAA
jgi:hypothetical protein